MPSHGTKVPPVKRCTRNTAVVFVADTSTRFSVREVTVGSQAADGAGDEGSAIVTAGLRPGERVAATSTFLLKSELANAARAREP